MSKRFRLAPSERTSPSTSPHLITTDWSLCLICQEDKTETLTKPDQSKRKDIGSGYSSLAENLIKFSELGELPGSFHLERLDDGHGIEAAMVAHGAQYHQTCRLQYNNTKLQRAQKRALKKKVRAMRNNLYANAPGHIHVHRVQRRSQKLVSSVDNLLGLTVFEKLQHSKWTDGCVPVQPFLVIQNCLAVSVVGTW